MPYNAFISYSHAADSALASALQSALHRFATPWYKLRGLHIFRDQTNLAVNPALWSSIREALDQSLYLILFASPEAAASPWVEKEAAYWIGRNGSSHVLLVLTGGTLKWNQAAAAFVPGETSALPPNLLSSFSEEPLFLDLLWARNAAGGLRMREPRFHEAVLQLAATLRNRPKDELDGADVRLQRQTRLLAAFALLVVLLTALYALRQTRLDREESVQNFAASLAVSSAKVLADNPDRIREATLLAIESNRLHSTFEANQALRHAVSLLPAGGQFYQAETEDQDQRVRDLAFSPDGAVMAVVRDNGSTQLINLASHKPLGYFAPDEKPVAAIDLRGDSPNASPGGDNADNAISVAFNFTGSLIASGARGGVVHVWSFPGAREALRISLGAPLFQIAFHPAANQLATASEDGHVRIFDVTRAALAADLQCSGKVVSMSFNPSGERLAALSSDGPVYLFDVPHATLLGKLFDGAEEAALNLAFSKDGKRLVTAAGSFAFVWDVATGKELLKATHSDSTETLNTQQWITNAALSADGKVLAYAAKGDNLAHVWNVETGRQFLALQHDSPVAAVSFSADGTKLGTGSYDGTARVWELPSGRELERAAHANGAEVVAFSPGGDRFAAGGMNGSVMITEMRRADRPASFDFPGDVRSVAFSPDGTRFAMGATSANWSPLVRVADISGTTLRNIEFHGAPVIDKLFFVDANRLLAQWSNNLFLIDIGQSSVTPLPELRGDLRIDPTGKVMAIQQNDGSSKIFSLPGLQQTATLEPSGSELLGPAGAGSLLAFQTRAQKSFFVDIWGVAGKARVSHISLPAELNKATLNPAGTILFTAEDEKLQAWEIPSGKARFSLTAGGNISRIIADPSAAAVATIDGHLTVWNGATGARLAELPATNAAAFSPDGRYLLSEYGRHSAALWLWRSSDLQDAACVRLSANFSREEWSRWFPKQPYRLTCPKLPPAK